tara:strand:+ start:40 stop:378 length:339 start_codon:yes stop_codon:yes gene_type:complete
VLKTGATNQKRKRSDIMWENILKASFSRVIAIPIMQDIFNSGVHPLTIYRNSPEYEALRDDFVNRYGDEAGHRTRAKFKNAIKQNRTKYDNAISAYARIAGFEILKTKRRDN